MYQGFTAGGGSAQRPKSLCDKGLRHNCSVSLLGWLGCDMQLVCNYGKCNRFAIAPKLIRFSKLRSVESIVACTTCLSFASYGKR